MGKHEKGTPKEIANRCKSKGLQKLRWFCEMCQKQCRDQNGFKCHLTSEAHQRQLLLFAENPEKYMREFSKEFEQGFMRVMRTSFGTRRVRANEVYQEYIKDKLHVHMNSTRWHTLNVFVQYIGNAGKAKVDKNEKGWWVQYIDQEEEVRKAEEAKKEKRELDDEQRQLDILEVQAQRARQIHGEQEYTDATELVRNDEEKISLDLISNKKPTIEALSKPMPSLGDVSVFDSLKKVKKEENNRWDHRERRCRSRDRSHSRERKHDGRDLSDARRKAPGTSANRLGISSKRSALDDIREEEERRKAKKGRKDNWMCPGIMVKVVTKKLGNDYYKSKGVVTEMIDDYTAKVKFDDIVVKLDQSHVETVIPQVGREMMIVNGGYNGTKAVLLSLDEKNFSVNLKLSTGLCRGREVSVPYEDASKWA